MKDFYLKEWAVQCIHGGNAQWERHEKEEKNRTKKNAEEKSKINVILKNDDKFKGK